MKVIILTVRIILFAKHILSISEKEIYSSKLHYATTRNRSVTRYNTTQNLNKIPVKRHNTVQYRNKKGPFTCHNTAQYLNKKETVIRCNTAQYSDTKEPVSRRNTAQYWDKKGPLHVRLQHNIGTKRD
jgi:hypothetical protein